MQLVELQEKVLGRSDVAVVGISYDPVEVLNRFAESRGITFSLLSDIGCRVLDALGLISPVTDDDLEYWGFEKKQRHIGLPYPGVFLLDASGVVVEKKFERSHRNRYSASSLLEALGKSDAVGRVVATGTRSGVTVRASVPDDAVYPNQGFDIEVSVAVTPGRHIYVDPVPDGYQALTIGLEAPDGVFWQPPKLPSGHALEIPELGERFSVVEADFDVSIKTHIHESVEDVSVDVVVAHQTCDDISCDPPTEIRLSLPIAVRPKG